MSFPAKHELCGAFLGPLIIVCRPVKAVACLSLNGWLLKNRVLENGAEMTYSLRIIQMLVAILLVACTPNLPAQTSENNPRLKEALERYPAADANKDGILTRAEALAFRDQIRTATGHDSSDSPAGWEQLQGRRFVYKRIDDVELALYVYVPNGHEANPSVPAMVFFHGGGWTSGSPKLFEPNCQYLADRGMVAITVQYRLAARNGTKIEDCIEDAKSAMRWVRANAAMLGIDPNRIGAGGGSAGGHLAACTAVFEQFNAVSDPANVSAVPNAMVLFNPALGLDGDAMKEEARRMTHLSLGPLEECMPLKHADAKQAPCIMFFGTKDRLLAGAELYRTKSVEAGNQCEIVTYAGQGHGFFNQGKADGKYFNLTNARTEKFLVDLGWLSPMP
jgi:acetyl esterase/lipase